MESITAPIIRKAHMVVIGKYVNAWAHFVNILRLLYTCVATLLASVLRKSLLCSNCAHPVHSWYVADKPRKSTAQAQEPSNSFLRQLPAPNEHM